MTKEQEAIEKLTNGEKIDFNILIRKFKREGIENFVVTKKEYIETVLNMLKENSAEIEQKNTELAEKNAEIEKKDKIIDLYIDKLARDEFDDCCQECCRECERDYDTLSNCIKQYFERKVKMEIEVGEYVRTKNGEFDKVQNYSYNQKIWHCENGMCIDECNCIGTHLEEIVKHSKNIIDLIEIGDILEIELSEEFVEKEDKKVLIQIGDVYTKETLQKDIDNGIITKILTILTKEKHKIAVIQ